jgi:hypothetical protein
MIKLLLGNLNTLLKSNYYDENIVDKFKYFIITNYYDETIVDKFKCFIKIKLP